MNLQEAVESKKRLEEMWKKAEPPAYHAFVRAYALIDTDDGISFSVIEADDEQELEEKLGLDCLDRAQCYETVTQVDERMQSGAYYENEWEDDEDE